MKKYIIVVFVFFVPCVTHAITMCARNNSLVGSVTSWAASNSVTGHFSNTEPFWRVVAPFGTIFGEATKLSASEGGEPSKQYSITNINGKMIPMDTPAGLVGDDANGNPREYCWCRMTHPMISRWVSPRTSMYQTCQQNCLYDVQWYSHLIGPAMFKSVFDTLADED